LRDAHLGSIWEGTSNIVALDAIARAVGRHGAQGALGAELHARLSEASAIPPGWRDRLRSLVDRAVGLAQNVAADPASEADARSATTALYHVTSAVMLAWEGARIHERRGDARRMLLSRLVVDHRLASRDPFAPEARDSSVLGDLLLHERAVPLAEAAVHLC